MPRLGYSRTIDYGQLVVISLKEELEMISKNNHLSSIGVYFNFPTPYKYKIFE
jgi:hypothetical protein